MAVNDELTLPLSKLLKKASVSFCCCNSPLHSTVLLCARGSIEAAYVMRLDLASHRHIFSFKCSSCHGEVEYQKIILVRSSPHELLAELGWNS